MRTTGVAIIALAVGFAAGLLMQGRLAGRKENTPDESSEAASLAPPTAKGATVAGLNGTVYRYDEKVFRGGDIQAVEGAEALKNWGVKTVVSVTPTDLERKLCEKYGLKLVELPFEKSDLSGEKIDKFLDAMKTDEGPFYLHCHGGSHRGGALGLIYRLGVLGWEPRKAIHEYEERGGNPDTQDEGMVKTILEHLDKTPKEEER